MRCLVLYLGHNNGSASLTCCFDVLRDSLKAKGKENEFSVVLLEPKLLFQHFPFFLFSLLFLVFGLSCVDHEVLLRCSVTFAMGKNNALCKVPLVRCIQYDKNKPVVLKLLSLAHEVQDQS